MKSLQISPIHPQTWGPIGSPPFVDPLNCFFLFLFPSISSTVPAGVGHAPAFDVCARVSSGQPLPACTEIQPAPAPPVSREPPPSSCQAELWPAPVRRHRASRRPRPSTRRRARPMSWSFLLLGCYHGEEEMRLTSRPHMSGESRD